MKRLIFALIILVAAGIPQAAKADGVVLGVLNTIGTATISLGGIDFPGSQLFVNGPAVAQQGGFTALAGTTGAIEDIADPAGSGALDVPDFITFAAAPNISITLTYLNAGIDGSAGCSLTTPAAGQTCTPDEPFQSPFNFQNTSATSSTASFNIVGQEVDATTGNSVPIVGAFTMPFANMNYQEILAALDDGGSVTTSFSAQFATNSTVTNSGPTIPEPATLCISLGGLGLIGLMKRRRYNRQRRIATT